MQRPIRRLFTVKRFWLLFLISALASPLIGITFAAPAAAPAAQDDSPAANYLYDVASHLTCTANDVRISRYILVEGPTACRPGEMIPVRLQAELVSTAQNHHDIGLFIAQDGGDAATGLC